MKSFKQHNEAYTDRFTHQSAEDDNLGLFNVQDLSFNAKIKWIRWRFSR